MNRLSAQTMKTLLLTFISGILSGQMFEIDFWLFGVPFGSWFPGLVFGFLFGMVNITKVPSFIFFTIVSGIIYFLAYNIFFFMFNIHFVIGGLFAGSFGAFSLSVVNKVLARKPLGFFSEGLSTLIGGITGMIFAIIILNILTLTTSLAPYMSLAFVIWQVPVGWSLTTNIQTNSDYSSAPHYLE